MNRSDFGKLVTALRREQLENGAPWTRERLTEAMRTFLPASVSEDDAKKLVNSTTLKKIEQGRFTNLKPVVLVALADALHLNAQERQEFFMAASGMEAEDVGATGIKSSQILADLDSFLRALPAPAYITDVYSRVVKINQAAVIFFDLQPLIKLLRDNPNATERCTTWFVFNEASLYPRLLGPQLWEKYIRRHLAFFRAASLRYRHRPVFQELLKSLLKLDNFRACWEGYFALRLFDPPFYFENEIFVYRHPFFNADINYFLTVRPALTPFGELYVIHYVPGDLPTAHIFDQLAQSRQIYNLGNWPFDL